MGYIQDIRKLVGTRPIIMVGTSTVVLNKENEILLQRRADSGDWGVIGGALELGESLEEGAKRELYEEAGLRSDNMKFIDILSGEDMYYKYPHGDEIYNVVAVYETREYSGTPFINDDETLELRFFNPKEPIKELNEMARQILTKTNYIV